MNLQNVAGAPVSLNGITSDSKSPKRVRKAVRCSCPSFFRTLLNAEIMSIFVKYFIPLRLFRVSLISRSGYRSLTEISFRAQQSIHKQSPPLGFLIKRTGEVTCKELSQMNPLARFSSSQVQSVCNSSQDIEQILLNRSFLLEFKRILWSKLW